MFTAHQEEKINIALKMIEGELRKALKGKPEFNSSHEAYAVLKEEVDELWDEIKNNKQAGTLDRQLDEATQVGAMAAKFIIQINTKKA